MADIFEFSLIADVITKILNDTMRSMLESKKYNPNKVAEWIDAIGSASISKIKEVSPNFKYIVSTTIVQKVGAGIHTETASYWDATTDGVVSGKFENDSLIATCVAFGIAI
jgi:dynein light chain Tctex-type 1